MCVIIASENGKRPDASILRQADRENPHGWGIMHPKDGKIEVYKGFKIKKLLSYMEEKLPADTPFVLHFRWATHGTLAIQNVHPFRVTDDLWMAHNGVLQGITPRGSEHSDTWHFAHDIMRPYVEKHPHMPGHEQFIPILEKYLQDKKMGYSNKLAFLQPTGKILIVNRKQGEEHEGCWYSNHSVIPRQYSGYSGDDWCGFYNSQYNHHHRSNGWAGNDYTCALCGNNCTKGYIWDGKRDARFCSDCWPKRETIKIACSVCKQERPDVCWFHEKGQRFCSRDCMDKARAARYEGARCKQCNADQPAQQWGWVDNAMGVFCSYKCSDLFKEKSTSGLKCTHCGADKNRYGNWWHESSGTYCSHGCKQDHEREEREKPKLVSTGWISNPARQIAGPDTPAPQASVIRLPDRGSGRLHQGASVAKFSRPTACDMCTLENAELWRVEACQSYLCESCLTIWEGMEREEEMAQRSANQRVIVLNPGALAEEQILTLPPEAEPAPEAAAAEELPDWMKVSVSPQVGLPEQSTEALCPNAELSPSS